MFALHAAASRPLRPSQEVHPHQHRRATRRAPRPGAAEDSRPQSLVDRTDGEESRTLNPLCTLDTEKLVAQPPVKHGEAAPAPQTQALCLVPAASPSIVYSIPPRLFFTMTLPWNQRRCRGHPLCPGCPSSSPHRLDPFSSGNRPSRSFEHPPSHAAHARVGSTERMVPSVGPT